SSVLVTGAAVRRDDERVDASRATGAEVVVAPRPALTGTRLDPVRGRQRIEASPGKEHVSGSEMGGSERTADAPLRSKAVACALRCDRRKRRTVALRAAVGSTEASDGRLARVGRIDRINLGSSNFGCVGPAHWMVARDYGMEPPKSIEDPEIGHRADSSEV